MEKERQVVQVKVRAKPRGRDVIRGSGFSFRRSQFACSRGRVARIELVGSPWALAFLEVNLETAIWCSRKRGNHGGRFQELEVGQLVESQVVVGPKPMDCFADPRWCQRLLHRSPSPAGA